MPALEQMPLEFLLESSSELLQNLELSKLNHAANLRREALRLLDQWADETAAAMVARWFAGNRKELCRMASNSFQKELFEFPQRREASF